MANRRVRVVRSVKVKGVWKSMSPVVAQQQRIPNDQGRWYITWRVGDKKEWERADSWTHALKLKLKKEGELHAVSAGVELAPSDPARLTLKDAIAHFTDDLTLLDRRHRTMAAYKLMFSNFQAACKKTYLDQIERRDLLKFAASLRKDGLSPRTVSNRWLAFAAFLKHHGIVGLSKKGDAPKFVEAEPECYEKEEVAAFFAACDASQRLLFEFLLKSGARMQEAMYCTWADFDFKEKTFRVKSKPEFEFRPKSWEERTIPLEEGLAAKLQARQKALKRSGLVFPTRSGKPNNKMLQACKRIAKRAGLDPEKFWLHKFRATFCTWHADAGVPIPTIQLWMGHKDLATTMRYLRPNRSAEARAKFNATFAGV
jgi:integrase/recombinase XerD